MRPKLAILVLVVLGSVLAVAQQQMDNESIGKMIKAGLSDDIIIKTVVANSGKYDTTADGIIALKAAGASDRVIEAIQKKSIPTVMISPVLGGLIGNAPAPKTRQPDVAEPAQMGKMFFLNSEKKALEPLPGERWKRKNRSGFGSFKVVDIVAGIHSSFRVSSKDKLVFVFRPLPGQYPQAIRIFPFEVKGEDRECVVSISHSGFSGGSNQGNEKMITLEVVKYGIFSFAVNPPGFHLEPGEYWVTLPGAGLDDPLFTFGVD